MKLAPQPVRCILDADHTPRHQLSPFLSIDCRLFVFSFCTPPFVFNSLQPLFSVPVCKTVTPAVNPAFCPRLGASAAIDLFSLCFHTLTNPFSHKPFLFTSIQNPRGGGGHLCHPSMEIVRMSPVASLERVYGTGSAGEGLLFFYGFYEEHDEHSAGGRDAQ